MKNLLLILFVVFSSAVEANESNEACKKIDVFFPYKAGIVAERAGEQEYAFDIFCNLAFKGDYRAQFQLAQYYREGIENYIEPNIVYATVWAKIANSKIETRRKSSFIEELIERLTKDNLNEVNKLYASARTIVPTGIRIDMKYKPLDLDRILKEHNKKKQYTGSRIRRSEPPPGLGVIK